MPNDSSTIDPRPQLIAAIRAAIIDVPDFPKAGVSFKDLSPLLGDPDLFRRATDALAWPWKSAGITHVVAIESRGFIFGAPVAQSLGAALVLVRKPGKLPRACLRESYDLEYGQDVLEIHADALGSGSRVLIVDDVIATGGTAAASIRLAARAGAEVIGVGAILDLAFLHWRGVLERDRVETLVTYS